jgi:hypothetical protein
MHFPDYKLADVLLITRAPMDSQQIQEKFRGWKEQLDPENLSLLSILKFRKEREDFTGDSRSEHF